MIETVETVGVIKTIKIIGVIEAIGTVGAQGALRHWIYLNLGKIGKTKRLLFSLVFPVRRLQKGGFSGTRIV